MLLKKIIKKSSIYLVILILVFVLVGSIVYNYNYHIMTGRVLRDAKNIQLAMRILSIEYYGQERLVYTPDCYCGMSKETIESIKSISGTDGEITLTSWNYAENIPQMFYYQSNNFLVVYEYDNICKEPSWKIYSIKLLSS